MSTDPKVLSQLRMNELMLRISLNIGFQFMLVKEVVDCMKRYHSCINNDKCTFNNSQKKFIIHVRYFDIVIGESVVQHYKSVSSREGNVKSLLECIWNCFIRDDIQNLVSDLSDSTNYMRRA